MVGAALAVATTAAVAVAPPAAATGLRHLDPGGPVDLHETQGSVALPFGMIWGVELEGVGVRYRRRAPWVVLEVFLVLAAGEVVAVTGRNGAGKSTLLRVLAGVLPPVAGAVRERPRVVGWAPERFPAGQPFSVEGYLRAQARVRGLRGRRSSEAVADQVDRWHLHPFLGTPLPDLSKGSAQKVGLAQALLVPPDLLILDEPWSGLDADARQAVPVVVQQVRESGGTVVVTDHQQQASGLLVDRTWHVADRHVRQQPAAPRPAPRPGPGEEPDGSDEYLVEVPHLGRGRAEDLVEELRERGLRAHLRGSRR